MAEPRRALAALLAVLALGVAGCGSAADRAPVSAVSGDDDGYHGTHLDDPYLVPDITLPDAEGKPYSLAKDPTPLKVVFFGYTNCPDICQAVMSSIASAVSRLDDTQRTQVRVVFVTTDPARDTGPVLRSYLARFDPAFTGVTGDLKQITALGDPLKVYVDKGQKLPSGGYEVDHSTYVFGIAGDRAQTIWTQGTSPAAMAADIIKLLKS
ncbi:protein SCO1 [Marmoricola sp. URHA0025 HA25]